MFETCITKSNVPFENERHFSLKDKQTILLSDMYCQNKHSFRTTIAKTVFPLRGCGRKGGKRKNANSNKYIFPKSQTIFLKPRPKQKRLKKHDTKFKLHNPKKQIHSKIKEKHT